MKVNPILSTISVLYPPNFMIASLTINGVSIRTDFSKPIDISIPVKKGKETVHAFYIPDVQIEPLEVGSFVGSVERGGSCNVNNIVFNPHGNGTHTECAGHISREFISLNENLRSFFFLGRIVSIEPESDHGDKVITASQLKNACTSGEALYELTACEALIIRTLPNGTEKKMRDYSGTNPAYLHHEAAAWLCNNGIRHLLLDLPSVDKEDDGGMLLAHHAFWNYPSNTRLDSTITEFVFVPDEIPDGFYLLNLMVAGFENDASPSKPVLYRLLS